MHTLEVKLEECSPCHTGASQVEDLKNIRMQGSAVDYDGDGDIEEGIYYEIEGLQGVLYGAIQAYASDAGVAVVYDSHAYPYFFIDTNANGEPDEDEANYGNKYNAWTPRLLKAAYNYQTSKKDPGAFAHGLDVASEAFEALQRGQHAFEGTHVGEEGGDGLGRELADPFEDPG